MNFFLSPSAQFCLEAQLKKIIKDLEDKFQSLEDSQQNSQKMLLPQYQLDFQLKFHWNHQKQW